MASAQKSGPCIGPGHEAAGRGGVVAERDAVGVFAGAAVAGDGDPDLGAAVGDGVAGVEAELRQGARTARLDDDVRSSDELVEDADSLRRLQVERDRSLATVHEVVEGAGAATGPVGSLRRLHLDDGGAGSGQKVAAQGARPQRRQVDDEQRRRCRVAAGPLRAEPGSRRRVACRRSDRVGPLRRRERPGARAAWARSRRTAGSRSRRAVATADQEAGAEEGAVSSSSQAGTISMSSSRGSETAMNPSAQGNRRQLPPQLVAPRRHSPMSAARSPRRASVSSPGNDRPNRSTPSTRPAGGPSGSSGSPVRAMAPLFGPALHRQVVHDGRVTSRDPRTSERRSPAR